MQPATLIQQYNNFNGETIKVSSLKEYHAQVQKYLDSAGSGPHVPLLKGIHERITKTIKAANGFKKIKAVITPVKLPAVKPAIVKTSVPKAVKKPTVKPRVLNVAPEVEKPPVVLTPIPSRNSMLESLGFVSADKVPDKPKDTFMLPGPMGALYGTLQRYKLVFVIAGETASSKSQLGMQIANAFGELGDDVAWLDYEQGGMHSRDTQLCLQRNTSALGKSHIKIKGDHPRTLEAIKELAKTAKVIAIDSASILRLRSNTWMEEFREHHPYVVFIIMFQLTGDGTTRGGTGAEFDAPVVTKTFRPDLRDPLKNFAIVEKNRGNKTGIKYLINQKKFTK